MYFTPERINAVEEEFFKNIYGIGTQEIRFLIEDLKEAHLIIKAFEKYGPGTYLQILEDLGISKHG